MISKLLYSTIILTCFFTTTSYSQTAEEYFTKIDNCWYESYPKEEEIPKALELLPWANTDERKLKAFKCLARAYKLNEMTAKEEEIQYKIIELQLPDIEAEKDWSYKRLMEIELERKNFDKALHFLKKYELHDYLASYYYVSRQYARIYTQMLRFDEAAKYVLKALEDIERQRQTRYDEDGFKVAEPSVFLELADIASKSNTDAEQKVLEYAIGLNVINNKNKFKNNRNKNEFLDESLLNAYKHHLESDSEWVLKNTETMQKACANDVIKYGVFLTSVNGHQFYTSCENWGLENSALEKRLASRLKPIKAPMPKFPTKVVRAGIEGWARVLVDIDINGKVTKCRLDEESPKNSGIGEFACKAAKQSTFEPRVEEGKTVAVQDYDIHYVYKLAE